MCCVHGGVLAVLFFSPFSFLRRKDQGFEWIRFLTLLGAFFLLFFGCNGARRHDAKIFGNLFFSPPLSERSDGVVTGLGFSLFFFSENFFTLVGAHQRNGGEGGFRFLFFPPFAEY